MLGTISLHVMQRLADSGPLVSLSPETITHWHGLTISNSFIYGVVCALLLTILMVVVRTKIHVKAARGIAQFFEILTEFSTGVIEGPLGSRERAVKYAPIFAIFFIFIIFSNLMELMPVVGLGVYARTAEGAVPLFRPFTADLNGTLAMAIIAIIIVQYLSIKESGFLGHLKHYFTDKPFNPINLFIGILEVLGEFTRILSLSLRLFLNTAVGDILLSVFAYVGKDFQSFTLLPIYLFEALVAGIQAYVFMVLCATYLGLAISHGHDDEHRTHEVDPVVAGLEGDVSH
jgi:F-type H+-transporting ATPase subunit a